MRRESDTLRPGAKAPDFALVDPQGATYSLRDLLPNAGAKVPAYEKDVAAFEQNFLLLVFDRGTW
jgi:peroxiredoxin